MELTQTRLIVTDFQAVFEFYRDVIGLHPQFDPAPPPYAAFKPELGSTLALHERKALADVLGDQLQAAGSRGLDTALVCLRVDDIDEYLAEVTNRGGKLLTGPLTQGDRMKAAYLRDPEGNLIEIQQWLATRTGQAVPSANAPLTRATHETDRTTSR